jgi:hypothetical protein
MVVDPQARRVHGILFLLLSSSRRLELYQLNYSRCQNILSTTLMTIFVRSFIPISENLATGRGFSPGRPVSSTNTTERHDITEILLNVTLNTINQPTKPKT